MRELCVDADVAWAVACAWEAGIATTNSCQAWGEWDTRRFPGSHARRIDVTNSDDACTLAALLALEEFEVLALSYGGYSLTWFSDPARD